MTTDSVSPERLAELISYYNPPGSKWDRDTLAALRELAAAKQARAEPGAAAQYAKANPLGGPASMFRVMAERIEAGEEEYHAVLADYGLQAAAWAEPDWRRPLEMLVALVPEPELVSMGYDSPPEHRTQEEHELGYALHLAREALAAPPVAAEGWKRDEEPIVPRALFAGSAVSTEEFAAAIARCCLSFGTTAETAHKIAGEMARARDAMLAAAPKEPK